MHCCSVTVIKEKACRPARHSSRAVHTGLVSTGLGAGFRAKKMSPNFGKPPCCQIGVHVHANVHANAQWEKEIVELLVD